MKLEIETKKLYYGFPVILIGYKDSKWRYNITTSSSSYSLGDMITVGITKSSNAIKNIKEYGEFTINIPCQEILNKVEMAGFHSGQNKIGMADMTYDLGKYVDAPVLDECLLGIECVVDKIVEHGEYANIIGTIKRRVVCDEVIDEEGKLKSKEFDPIYFLGDEHQRIYRYFNKEESKVLGENMGCSADENEITCG
ncbi:flavin reductase family protein [Gemella cuniculi]|uniref:flavin reductase family protein n=1 Tax=Gemella cuniculi TaxID=150240 RepID=UPI0004202402|nr:flavin reductase family protein [Gemella cuniculi]